MTGRARSSFRNESRTPREPSTSSGWVFARIVEVGRGREDCVVSEEVMAWVSEERASLRCESDFELQRESWCVKSVVDEGAVVERDC